MWSRLLRCTIDRPTACHTTSVCGRSSNPTIQTVPVPNRRVSTSVARLWLAACLCIAIVIWCKGDHSVVCGQAARAPTRDYRHDGGRPFVVAAQPGAAGRPAMSGAVIRRPSLYFICDYPMGLHSGGVAGGRYYIYILVRVEY